MKSDIEFINKDQKKSWYIAVWVIQSWEKIVDQTYMNCVSDKEVFVDCKIFKELFDETCDNCKKRDHDV